MKELTACTAQNGRDCGLIKKCAYAVCEKICKIFKLRITLDYSGRWKNDAKGDFVSL